MQCWKFCCLGILVINIMGSVVSAECTPTPDCISLGYTETTCEGKFVRCPFDISKLFCAPCDSIFKYSCNGNGEIGKGKVCNGKYIGCACSDGYVPENNACVCDSSFKYTCNGTGYSGGSGTACGGKYKSCVCTSLYEWNGSSCIHMHSYSCPSGYSTSSSGIISPISVTMSCACGATSGTCYKEGHSHSYSCPSGYSTSCTYGYSDTASKECSCGATSGTCYSCMSKCEANPCASGCYTDLSCTYGCDSYNSCGGCDSCSSDPCAGVSCPSAKSCTYGCADYSSATSCCSSVCTSCLSKCEANPCASGCYTDLSCDYGCASTNSCGGCNSCASDPCASVTCPTASSCTYGCAGYSTATSCCSSVCTSCLSKCEADPCNAGCYTNLSCSGTCKTYNSCGGCEECAPDCSELWASLSAACGGCPGTNNADCCRSADAQVQQCLSGVP